VKSNPGRHLHCLKRVFRLLATFRDLPSAQRNESLPSALEQRYDRAGEAISQTLAKSRFYVI
jgi:hypothetical protein